LILRRKAPLTNPRQRGFASVFPNKRSCQPVSAAGPVGHGNVMTGRGDDGAVGRFVPLDNNAAHKHLAQLSRCPPHGRRRALCAVHLATAKACLGFARGPFQLRARQCYKGQPDPQWGGVSAGSGGGAGMSGSAGCRAGSRGMDAMHAIM